MALRAGALASPAARTYQEASRGRQCSAPSRCSLAFPAKGRKLILSAGVVQSRRNSSQQGSRKISLPAAPQFSAVDRLSVSCGTGIAQPGEDQGECSTSGRSFDSLRVPSRGMARLGSAGGATLQKSKLNLSQKVQTQEPKVDDGAGGGNNGKNIFNGGGGDNDGGDDDDYFDNFDGGDGEDGGGNFFRTVVEQLYDRKSINAVLQEWFRTLESLPAILRGSVEMGLFSSAQLVRFLSMDVRPNVARAVTRSLPPQFARDIVGRMMADPAFVHKLATEELLTVGSALVWEVRQRRERFTKELDFVAINTLSLAAATGALVWLMSPNRASGVLKAGWQRQLHDLPNHIFDASSPARRITASQRVTSLIAKAAQLGAVGTIAGTAMSGLAQLDLRLRQMSDPAFAPSVPIPSLPKSAIGMAASMGVFSNARYQLVGGIDRYLFEHAEHLLPYLGASAAFRWVSTKYGNETRLHFQGLPVKAPNHVYKQRLGQGVTVKQQLPAEHVSSAAAAAAPKKAKKRAAAASRGFEMSASMAGA